MPDAPGDAAAELRAANARLRELLAERDAEVAGLRALVAGLQAQVADLAARLGQNSKNSSKPPSSDGLAKPAPKSLRVKSGRKPGRPKGQPGATMQPSEHPDRLVRHEPSCCAGCAAGLAGAPQAGVIRRQVTEIPPVRAQVTEHQMISWRCGCGTVSWGKASGGVTAPALDAIVRALTAAEVAHFDETGFRVAGKLAWVRSASSGKFVLVTVHARRGKDGMDAAGVLPGFTGIACHDAWAPYDCYAGVAGRALCNAHLLRELAAVTETGTADDVIWARQAIDALLQLKTADAARAAGDQAIDAEILHKHGRGFRDAAAAGITPTRSGLGIRCRRLAGKRVMPAVVRWLVERRPPELVMTGVAGNHQMSHAPASFRGFPGGCADAWLPAHLRLARPELMAERASLRLVSNKEANINMILS